jgi:hypothetical protein
MADERLATIEQELNSQKKSKVPKPSFIGNSLHSSNA